MIFFFMMTSLGTCYVSNNQPCIVKVNRNALYTWSWFNALVAQTRNSHNLQNVLVVLHTTTRIIHFSPLSLSEGIGTFHCVNTLYVVRRD